MWNATLSGAPQGGVVSPSLSNIYLHRLDKFVETVLMPEYTRGKRRKRNPEYGRVKSSWRGPAHAGTGNKGPGPAPAAAPPAPGRPPGPRLPAAALLPLRRRSPAGVHRTEGRSRGHQGSAGAVPARRPRAGTQPGQDADHPRPHPGGAVPRLRDHRPALRHKITNGRRSVNGTIALRVPLDVIKAKRAPYRRHGKPWHRPALQNLDDYDIVPSVTGPSTGASSSTTCSPATSGG